MSSAFVILPTNEVVSVGVILVVNTATPGGGGSTNLGYTAAAGNGVVTSDTGTDATIPAATNTNAGLMLPAEKTKLAGIEENADVTDAANVAAAGAFMKATDDTDDIIEGATNKFATATEKAKLANITISQAVDLDAIESRVNELDAAVILKGSWDASAGTFPGSGVAQAGWSYVVSVSGTVDGVQFVAGDRIIALTDNASTATYASNWLKADYSDLVTALDGTTGNLTLGSIIANLTGKTTPVDGDSMVLSDSAASNASKKVTWANIKATIKTYFDTLYQATDATLTALAGLATGANKIPYSTGTDTFGQLDFKDEDDMSSNSASALPSQQSVKAYVDAGLATKASSTFIDAISGYISTLSDKTYKLVVKIPFACTINETVTICESGTATATFKINTTALGGTANSVSSAEQTQAQASANTVAAGDDIQLTISSNSSCLGMSFTIKITRTI